MLHSFEINKSDRRKGYKLEGKKRNRSELQLISVSISNKFACSIDACGTSKSFWLLFVPNTTNNK